MVVDVAFDLRFYFLRMTETVGWEIFSSWAALLILPNRCTANKIFAFCRVPMSISVLANLI